MIVKEYSKEYPEGRYIEVPDEEEDTEEGTEQAV